MAEFNYSDNEAFLTAVRLANNVGRLKFVSNLKSAADAQAKAFEHAGSAAALIAEGASREGPAQAALYRDARGALAQCGAWLHVLAAVTNEQPAVFAAEMDLAEHAARQLGASIRLIERGPGGPGRGPGGPGGPGGPRPGGGSNFTPRGGGRPAPHQGGGQHG